MLSTLLLSVLYFNISLNLDSSLVNFFTPNLSTVINKKVEYLVASAKKIVLAREVEATIGDIDFTKNFLKQKNTEAENLVALPVAKLKLPLKNSSSTDVFSTSAVSGLAMDVSEGTVLFEKNADEVRPIASITKLATALVFIDHNPGWDKIYEITKEDRREGGRIYLFKGEKVKVRDLFYLSLVASGNTETIALVSSTGLTETEFVEKMNEKVKILGLENTVFYDAVGLNDKNVSTPREVAKIAQIALENVDISQATLTKKYEFKTQLDRKKVVYSTDSLLGSTIPDELRILGGKTGYNEKAGYCFVGKFVDSNEHQVISVILGDVDKNSRFTQAYNLAEWVYANYHW